MQVANSGVRGSPALHFVVECAQPNGPVRLARTYFFSMIPLSARPAPLAMLGLRLLLSLAQGTWGRGLSLLERWSRRREGDALPGGMVAGLVIETRCPPDNSGLTIMTHSELDTF